MRPNYTRALNTSIEVLKRFKINQAPIDLDIIISQLSDLRICSYTRFANSYGCSITEIIDLFESDLGAISRKPKKNKFVIYYNDTKNNRGLERFTIAHELGHYFLGHFSLITEDVLNRGGLSSKKYKNVEKEANCFARNLLSPVPLYNRILPEPLTFEWRVMETFNITYDAAHTRKDFLKWDSYRIKKKHIDYFSTYKMPYFDFCETCDMPISQITSFCPICGKEHNDIDLKTGVFKVVYKLERSDYMIYEGIEVDENSKAIVCPTCENEEPQEGDYCSMCSEYLVNKCTKVDHYNRSDFDGPPCGKLLPGNARYCTYCGAESTFLRDKILNPWNVEKQALTPFLPHPADDIPF